MQIQKTMINKIESIVVVIDNNETEKRALDILSKHNQKMCDMEVYENYKYLVYNSHVEYWWVSKMKDSDDFSRTEITLDQLDEFLTFGFILMDDGLIGKIAEQLYQLNPDMTECEKTAKSILQTILKEFKN